MKFPFPFKSTDTPATSSAASSWPWPICAVNPRTLSFRATAVDDIFKTMSSDDDQNPAEFANATPDELIPSSPPHHNQESAVISGLRSKRLFFEPGATSSILGEAKEQSVAMVVMDSRNPFADFRVSMEEMVEARRVRDWEFLEELLEWYLRVNDESNHGCIVGAFVDLLIHLAIDVNSSSSSSTTYSSSSSSSAVTKYSFTSPLSFSSSILENEDEIGVHKTG